MYKPLLLLCIMASLSIATDISLLHFGRQLTARDSCSPQGEKECGSGCIPLTDTCCPDLLGGCPASKYCVLGSNNVYGCCENGQTCNGNGGSSGGSGTCADQGEKECGSGCIPTTDTCCPDLLGGCPASKYCVLGSDNIYGCCDNGQTCNGSGGSSGGNGTCADQGEKECGSGCIPTTDTCCPDGSGGCPASKYCVLGSDNQYGCCDNGKICNGDGGVSTITTSSGGGAGGGGATTTDSLTTAPHPTQSQTLLSTFPLTAQTSIQTTPQVISPTTTKSTTPASSTTNTPAAAPANGATSNAYGAGFAAQILGPIIAALFIFF